MKMVQSRVVTIGVLYVLTLLFGIWLSRAGKPYNGALFNLHKLISVGAVIVTVITIRHLRSGVDLKGFGMSAIVLSGLFVLFLIVTGALLSIGKPDHAAIQLIHKVSSHLLTVSGVSAVVLLASGA